ncbi:MAG: HPF/RaiA family ribosome-associated protein [Deltaproteobacteria bacterium]|nr:HPF/RaiA family ribosome-associated protein [Deltaproteobacteria bacterium]MBW2389004.1 HPF/RaiA family ribosome-associated protein [Deltaproteobacteria bacterium]
MRVRIRGQKTEITDRLRELAHRRIGFALGRYAGAIDEISLVLVEGGEAAGHERVRCLVSVSFARGQGMKVEQTGGDVSTALDAALESAARGVQRRLELRQRGFLHDDGEEPPQ